MKLPSFLLGIGMLCSVALQGQTLSTVTLEKENHRMAAVVPSVANLCAMLEMGTEKLATTLKSFGYVELQEQEGFRRFSNGTEQFPSYTQGLHMLLLDMEMPEVKYVTSLNLHVLGLAVDALKEELRSGYLGDLRDNDGYQIEVFALKRKSVTYEVYITNRPMYFEVAILRTSP